MNDPRMHMVKKFLRLQKKFLQNLTDKKLYDQLSRLALVIFKAFNVPDHSDQLQFPDGTVICRPHEDRQRRAGAK